MAHLAQCPFGPHKHRTKKAFEACRARTQTLIWTKDGQQTIKGKK